MSELPNFIANHPILVGAFILIVILLARNLLADSIAGVPAYTPAQVVLLINHENAGVLDVRSRDAYERGHIHSAVHAALAELTAGNARLPGDKAAWLVVCGEGGEAAQAAKVLRGQGYEKLVCLRGGLPAWIEANLPLEKSA